LLLNGIDSYMLPPIPQSGTAGIVRRPASAPPSHKSFMLRNDMVMA